MNYYNEWKPFAADWLRNLISAGLLPEGDVDERSVTEVEPQDLRGYSQCHFFAGIGGWPLALRMAGVDPSTELWTGSCPCQPFSAAGKGKGFGDERHLWPAWMRLIRECRPPVLFGEQVEAAIGHGWLDLVFSDLESEDYACGAAVLGAHSVGAPHKRQRLYWVGARGMGDAHDPRLEGHGRPVQEHDTQGRQGQERLGASAGFWDRCEWLECRDGCLRAVEPGLEPLAHGISGRVGQLRAYGNALVPQVAAEFVRAFLDLGTI